MRDGRFRRGLKRIARTRYAIDLYITRHLLSRNTRDYRLVGDCNGCGRCCERPTIRFPLLLFRMRYLRALTLFWHKWVNGFEFHSDDLASRTISFRCTHYDPVSKTCDSYTSRPGMCRDYPHNLTWAYEPELFSECSYRVIHRGAADFRAQLEGTDLSEAQREALLRKLGMDSFDV